MRSTPPGRSRPATSSRRGRRRAPAGARASPVRARARRRACAASSRRAGVLDADLPVTGRGDGWPLNVLVTAASRRVPLVPRFRRRSDARAAGSRHRDRRERRVAGRPCRRPRYRVPLATDPPISTRCSRSATPTHRSRGADDRRRAGASRAARSGSQAGAFASVLARRNRRTCNDKWATCSSAARPAPGGGTWLPGELPARRLSAVHQAAGRPRRVGAPGERRGSSPSSSIRRDADRAGVPRGPGVHDRRVLRFPRPAAVDRPARARGDSGRGHRPRAHGARPA